MADIMLYTAAKLALRSERSRGEKCWCTGPGVDAEMNSAWQRKGDARRRLRAEPHYNKPQKAVKMAGKSTWNFRRAAVLNLLSNSKSSIANSKHPFEKEGYQAGLYKNI